MDAGQTGRPPAVMWISTDPEQETPVRLRNTPESFDPAPGRPWVHIDGFVTPDKLLEEYRQALATR